MTTIGDLSTNEQEQLTQLRSAIAENDRRCLKMLEARVAMVQRLWRLKLETGVELEDATRELWLHTYLRRSNRSLKDSTVDALVDFLLDATKDEING